MLFFSLFITLGNKFHEIHLDNLYMSAKFAHLSSNRKNCVRVQGVCQTGGQSIPRELLQTELQDVKLLDIIW